MSITWAGVWKDESKYSTMYAMAMLSSVAKTSPTSTVNGKLCAGSAGMAGGTAIATFAMRVLSSASDVRSCSRLER